MAGYPPGWNDPPSLSFSQSIVSGGKRNVLNRRVPFQLNQSSGLPVHTSDKSDTLPNISSTVSANIDASTTSDTILCKESSEESNASLSEEEILPYVISIFDKILCENSDKYEKRRIDEIHNRINIMKTSWDSKISLPVKQKMCTLAQELSNGNADAALKIHCILMVDNLREVKQWMVGVKHIIEMGRPEVSL